MKFPHHFSTEAIILKTWDYGENDLIVSFVSRERGRLQGIAKGAKVSRRRFAGAIDLFSLSSLHFRERQSSTLVFLEQAKLISGFPGIRTNYNSILLATGLLEFAYSFYKEGERQSQSFEILLQGLRELEAWGEKREIFWKSLLKNLHAIGLLPQFYVCIQCRNSSRESLAGYEISRGGMICRQCLTDTDQLLKISPSLHHWMTIASQSSEISPLEQNEENALDLLLKGHLTHHLDVRLDWDRFLRFV